MLRGLSWPKRALSRLAEPQALFPLIGVVLLALVWGNVLGLISIERDATMRAAGASSREVADTYEAQVVRAVREIDQALKVVAFAHHTRSGRIDLAELKSRGLLLPELLFAVSIADRDGHIVASTRPGGLTDVSGMDFFIAQREGDALAVSRPLEGRAGEANLYFSRPLHADDGSFDGVAIVSVASLYFVAGYEPSRLGQHGVLALIGRDGVVRAGRTGDTIFQGSNVDYSKVVSALPEDGSALAVSPWDGVRRFTAARELYESPLAVLAGLSEHEQLQAVEGRAGTYIWRAVAASAVIVLVLAGLGRLAWQLARTKAQAHRALQDEISVRRQAESALKLRNRAIESSVNAILITDVSRPGRPIEYVNPAFERITGYPAAEVIGRDAAFMLGADVDQPGLQEIRLALREQREGHAVLRAYRRDGTPFWNEFFIAPVRDEEGRVTHFVEVMNDVTEARNYEEQLAHQAKFDPLTGLANRNLLQDRLQQAIAAARREGGAVAAVFLDVDHFKVVNDSLGHGMGDELLRRIGTRLEASVRESDTVARHGGDEFVLVLPMRESDPAALESGITRLMHKVLAAIAQPLALGERELRPTCSIGVSLYPQDGDTSERLLRNADAAMYRAKELGRNRLQFFTTDVHERIHHRMELESSLRRALERGELELRYQPQVTLRGGGIVGIEALLRWRHPQRGIVGPAEFIGFAEETGLIVPMGEWVLNEACRQNKAWQDAGLPAVPIAVNMSALQCEQPDVVDVIRRALDASGLAPEYLELEITESISMANPAQSVPLMHRLKETGVTLSIDDFGTGFSNLSYLRRFPVDRLKIDLSFVREITTDPGSLAISEAIITMSHSLRLQVVAEGVETEDQLALLEARDCDSIQGYYFSPPLDAGGLAQLLREDRRLERRPANVVHAASALVM
ncbi:MAG TPA: EAL domain-containing protein [Usitatibacter sp.]|jgi:diguanylate cyclase (GGDEF)-like protein/PAS domain S-box-containing protein|nr:EAL domain-containing protein [Usitatibacter sp.]